MDGWTISDTDNDEAVIVGTVIVPAGGFAVLCKNDNESANGGLACEYDYVSDGSPNNFFFIVNGDDELILRDGAGNEVDRVEYDRDADWPDEVGASMVYLDEPQSNNKIAAAWGVASAREGRYDEPGSDLGSPGVNGTGQVLPVELVRFTGRQDGEIVRLTWETASETQHAGFGVERSVDGSAFKQVAYLEGAGTTSEPQTYRHVDRDFPYAVRRVRYRLRQVDLDGTTSYSQEVEVQLGAGEAFALHQPFPNPASGPVTVRYELAQSGQLRLEAYDALGRRVETLVDQWQEADRMVTIFDASGLASGVYFVRLTAGGVVRTQKVTVLR